MRTASNSVLPVSPETLSKNTKSPISAKGEGRVFSDDFSKAQAALAPKQASSTEHSSVSQSADPAKLTTAVGAEQSALGVKGTNVTANPSQHDVPNASPITGKDQPTQPAESGKKLQLAGVESPVASLGAQGVKASAQPLSEETLLSGDNQGATSDAAKAATKSTLVSSAAEFSNDKALAAPLIIEPTAQSQAALPTMAATTRLQGQADADLLASQTKLSASMALPADGSNLVGGVAVDGSADTVVQAQADVVKPIANLQAAPSEHVSVAQASNAIASVADASQGEASPALHGDRLSSLPAKTELVKAVQAAQSSAPTDPLLPPTSGVLGMTSAEVRSVQGKINADQGAEVAAGDVSQVAKINSDQGAEVAAGDVSRLAPLTGLAVTHTATEQALGDSAMMQQGLLDQASLDANDVAQQASTDYLTNQAAAAQSAAASSSSTPGVSSKDAPVVTEVVPAGVLGLAAVDGETLAKTQAAASAQQSYSRSDSAVLANDTEITQDSELSWVLSQMQSPTDSKASFGPAGAALSATAVATPIIATNKRQQDNQINGVAGLSGVGTGLNVGKMSPMSLHAEQLSLGSAKDSTFTDMMGDNGVLLNEPIELRKKEQDAMIGKMAAQFDGTASRGDLDTGGMNSSTSNHHNVNRAVLGAGAATPATMNTAQASLTMNLPPNHPGWANEMSQKVAWVARDGGHTAHIRLDPPELGSLTVKVSVDHDSNTQVSFVAATPQARDLLEGQMSRLRDMLAQQGMDLSRADVDVSQQDASGAQYRQSAQDNNAGTNGVGILAKEELEDDLPLTNVSYTSATGIDYYA